MEAQISHRLGKGQLRTKEAAGGTEEGLAEKKQTEDLSLAGVSVKH